MTATTKRTSLVPIGVSFAVFGAFAGVWAVSVLDVQRAFGLTDLGLGLLLAVGILIAAGCNAVGGALADRWGFDAAFLRSLVLWSLVVLGVAASPVAGVFAVTFVLATATGGLLDVVMNIVAAAALAAEPGRLVRFHSLWNVGCFAGAALCGVAIEVTLGWRGAFAVVGAAGIALAVASRTVRLPDPRRDAVATGGGDGPDGSVPSPSLLRAVASLRHEGLVVLALVFAASAAVEGGIATWGVLYLRRNLGVGVVAGVGAYLAGQGLAAVTRVASGPVLDGTGARKGVSIGAGVAGVGIALVALTDSALVGGIGLALACSGISVVWPLLVAEVDTEARHPALAIGGVTAAGYLGMVAGPPVVGLISGAFGLATGLLALAATAAFVALTPARVRPPAGDPAQGPGDAGRSTGPSDDPTPPGSGSSFSKEPT